MKIAATAASRGAVASAFLLALLVATARWAPAQTETIVYSFTGGADGSYPLAGLTIDGNGNLYGANFSNGAFGRGTIFKLTSDGTYHLLYSFTPQDGLYPSTLVRDVKTGNLYGITTRGGAPSPSCGDPQGCGTVFELANNGTFTTLYSFTGGADGGTPEAGVVRDPTTGNLYGTTVEPGYGTVFEVTPNGAEKVLFNFGGASGELPYSPLLRDATTGNLYGMTSDGGDILNCGCGVVFELHPDGTEKVLHTFEGFPDGAYPQGGLMRDAGGNLWGTTYWGGDQCYPGGCGTVFEITRAGGEGVQYSFTKEPDGLFPSAGLVSDPKTGILYGATVEGGAYGYGTVFELDQAGMEKVLHSFNRDGVDGWYGGTALVRDKNGNLYGTTEYGGAFGKGTVFKITRFASTTVLTTSRSPLFVGQSVTFTATVTSSNGAIPDGELVELFDGTTFIGTGGTASGVATFTTSSLKAKTHTIKATYPGDTTFMPSSGTVQQVVNKHPTTTSLTSSQNPSQFGQAVTFTAQVTSSGPVPTGSVKFLDGTTDIGLVTLSGGVATLTKSTLAVGTHPITAQYLGDTVPAKSTSSVVNQVVQ